MGLFDVVVFSKAQSRFAKLILTSEVLTLEGRLQRRGHEDSQYLLSWKGAWLAFAGVWSSSWQME